REFMRRQNEGSIVFEIPAAQWQSDWGGNWSKWLDAKIPSLPIAVYAAHAARVQVDVYGPDSLWLASLGKVFLRDGYNLITYDLSIADDKVKPLQDAINERAEADKRVRIQKADNGKYYLPKGEYRIELTGNVGTYVPNGKEVRGDFGKKNISFRVE
ncbi:MAG: hypothetical protein ACKOSR_08835, partial [Flavobacteriales bacterium]